MYQLHVMLSMTGIPQILRKTCTFLFKMFRIRDTQTIVNNLNDRLALKTPVPVFCLVHFERLG